MEKETVSVNVNEAIALCLVFEQFEDFYEKFKVLLQDSKDGIKLLHILLKVSKGETCLASKKVKQFYQENKDVIDTINEYCNIDLFMIHDKSLLYDYYLKNKEQLSSILKVLEKVKKLGFSYFVFNENFDFSKEVYCVYKVLYDNHRITYFDKLEILPGYRRDIIEYKTNGSNYKIIVENRFSSIFLSTDKIFLNDLTFDVERLPESIKIDEIYRSILDLSDKESKTYAGIRNSIDLCIGIDDVSSLVSKFNELVLKMESFNHKEELITLLSNIKEILLKIKIISDEYASSVISEQDYVTETLFEKEKNGYIKRRLESNIHIH